MIWFWHKECVKERRKKKEEQFLKQFREWISSSGGFPVGRIFGGECIRTVSKGTAVNVSPGRADGGRTAEYAGKGGE